MMIIGVSGVDGQVDQLEIRLYSASVEVEVEVEAEPGHFINVHLNFIKVYLNFIKVHSKF